MFTVEVESNFKQFTQHVKQIPFATALALTRTAQDIQSEVRRGLPQRFTLRNDWVRKGIRIERAEKRNLQAKVYTKDDFMVLQETGGSKTPIDGKSIAVPEGIADRARKITRSMRPRAMMDDKRKVFRATIGGIDGLWRRVVATKRGHKRRRGALPRGIKLLYVFRPSVPIAPRLGMFATGERLMGERFARHFELSFAEAVRTAR